MAKLQLMSSSESREFSAMEEVLEKYSTLKGREAYWEVWAALRVIKSGRLYREKHSSFYSYLKAKGIDQSTASRGICALNIKDSIEERAWLYDKSKLGMIMSERHLRELNGLHADSIPEVVRIAFGLAGEDRVTYKHLKEARRKHLPPQFRKRVNRIDESGDSVPDIMAESFTARYSLLDVSEKIKSIVSELQLIASRPGGQYVQFEEIRIELGRISRAVAQSGFGVTCLECHGVGCTACRDTGFFPKRSLREE